MTGSRGAARALCGRLRPGSPFRGDQSGEATLAMVCGLRANGTAWVNATQRRGLFPAPTGRPSAAGPAHAQVPGRHPRSPQGAHRAGLAPGWPRRKAQFRVERCSPHQHTPRPLPACRYRAGEGCSREQSGLQALARAAKTQVIHLCKTEWTCGRTDSYSARARGGGSGCRGDVGGTRV